MRQERDEVIAEFKSVVNMTARQIKVWLETDDSKKVGYKTDQAGESVGHHSGRKIIEILDKKKADYDEDDLHHMVKVVGYVHRHLAQKPDGDIKETPWRFSLMNWGHDPTKASAENPKKSH